MGDEKLRVHYGRLSVRYDEHRNKRYFEVLVRGLLKTLLKTIPLKSKILEIGCGTGGYCIKLAKRGYKVKGIDYSPGMIDKSRQNGRGSKKGRCHGLLSSKKLWIS